MIYRELLSHSYSFHIFPAKGEMKWDREGKVVRKEISTYYLHQHVLHLAKCLTHIILNKFHNNTIR